jgi:hypothetical protein
MGQQAKQVLLPVKIFFGDIKSGDNSPEFFEDFMGILQF